MQGIFMAPYNYYIYTQYLHNFMSFSFHDCCFRSDFGQFGKSKLSQLMRKLLYRSFVCLFDLKAHTTLFIGYKNINNIIQVMKTFSKNVEGCRDGSAKNGRK